MSAIVRWTKKETVTIAADGDTSGSFQVGSSAAGSVTTPSALTGTTFTYEVSNDATTWSAVKDSAGDDISAVTVTTSKNYTLPAEVFSHKLARIKSGSSEAAQRSLTVFLSG